MRTRKPSIKKKRITKKCRSVHIYKNFEEHHNNNGEKNHVSLVNSTFTLPKYKITDDFYTYINYDWINNTTKKYSKTPKHYVQIDSIRIAQEKVYYELIDIVKQYVKHRDTKFSKSVKNVYDSLYNLDKVSAERYFIEYNKYIAEQVSNGDIYDILSNQNRNELISTGTPITWCMTTDDKNSKIYKSVISPPTLTLYDYNIYIQDDRDDNQLKTYKRQVKKQYINYIDSIFNLCLGKTHKHLAKDVWDCEYIMMKSMKNNDIDNEYFIININESKNEYGFDWHTFAKKIGYTDVPKTFVCSNKFYLKRIMKILSKEWKDPKWVTYYLYNCFRQAIRFHKIGRVIHYNFHEKFIAGAEKNCPREIYPIFGLSMCFNTLLCNEYNSRHKNEAIVNYVKDMFKDLVTVFKRILWRNNWLSHSTKKYAILKIDKIKLIIGSPDLLREDPLLNYDNKHAFENMIKISEWRTNKYIDMDGKTIAQDVPSINWNNMTMTGKQSYIVNAYYLPNENSIFIPYAYLQEPFVNLTDRGIEYNLASIGYTIAHEISHCLDDVGSKYDENGNMYDWWKPVDRKIFDSKIKNIVKQYETFAENDGIRMDASLSTGENIADISSLAICEEYLQDFHNKNEYSIPLSAISFQSFYVYFAEQSRQKINSNAIKAQLKVNPHPMEKYRVNCPFSRSKIFKNIFNIKMCDKMYWRNDEPIW